MGGSAYLVGGAVRDALMGRAVSDRDYVVCGVAAKNFLSEFPDARRVGRSFPVFLHEIDGLRCEIALARREKKSGSGYRGFQVFCSPEITIEEDLYRRDCTLNSMARDSEGRLIDPYGGARDIAARVVRATSERFYEDPVRALRAARQAAQFEFSIEPRTLSMMARCAEELRAEPAERKFFELAKAIAVRHPSMYFRHLRDAALLESEFPWLYRLIGKAQPPEFHPEGDAFEHTMTALDAAAEKTERPEVRFAVLMHDVGKGETPEEELPRHYGYEKKGEAMIGEIAAALSLPRVWSRSAAFAAREHMRASRMKSPPEIRDLIRALEKEAIGADGFSVIMAADNRGETPAFLNDYDRLLALVKKASKCKIPEGLSGPQIGEYIRAKEIEALKNDPLIRLIQRG
ncbi:MAG: HD domain-containing protein [Synergistes jonesii]|uniref:HD domain-containing protein n=1 Tax=Synergistes jonesii TaxID=2754 RepID=UPI002A764268|nr:HD domain-containing protein [Synergistes jonesii]MDY2985402.1 HD domain-containing protein [Synergistes jonesii]